MLHIRVVSPDEVTAGLVERLGANAGVTNLLVLPAAGTAPRGDAVQFDVTSGSANSVLGLLRETGVSQRSPIIIESIEAAITAVPHRPVWRLSHRGEHAPVWDLIEARIGACGILTNSEILIVGAMVVGPEYSAIISVALAIERRDGRTIGQGLLVLLVGFLAAIAVTFVFALCIRGLGHAPELYRRGVRPVSDLINSPNLFSVVVAVVAPPPCTGSG